jgi:glucosylceramidase
MILKNRIFNSRMVITLGVTVAILSLGLISGSCHRSDDNPPDQEPDTTGDVEMLVTTANKSMLLLKGYLHFNTKPNMSPATTITLNPGQRYQQIDGFGAAITGSTCYNLLRMTAENRAKLLTEAFDTVKGYGYSYIRISIGASDFSMDEYTCCDAPGIENFALHQYDKRDLIPILKEILAINPKLKIMASPWTCPRWMKVNNLSEKKPYNSWTSGQLNPAFYQDYATYFVKFIQAMEQEGIPIASITIQNEPLNRGNSVSLYMTWQEQAEFIRSALGPAFEAAGIMTKIVVFDHNYNYDDVADQKEYPLNIYSIPDAAKYVDGAAYHAYGGDKSEMLKVHNAAPAKNLYFTEMSIGTWNYTFDGDLIWSMRELGIGTLNNFNKAVIVWNFLLDEHGAPNRPGGCTTCFGAVEINSADYATLDRKSHFYVIAHLAHTLSPGAVRIGTAGFKPDGLHYTVAENPDGTYGAVLLNETDAAVKLVLEDENHSFPLTVPAKGITSCRWKK